MYQNHTLAVSPLQPLRYVAQTAFAFLIVGTGSVYGMEHSEEWRSYLQHRVPFIGEASAPIERVDVRSSSKHLENIRAVLNPAVSDLASIFDVSRQAIYKWLSGDTNPEPEKAARILALSQISDAFKEAGVSRAGSFIKMKVLNGQSLVDIVKAGTDWHQAVNILIAESHAMEHAYQRSGLAQSQATPTSDWQSYQSIPATRDDV